MSDFAAIDIAGQGRYPDHVWRAASILSRTLVPETCDALAEELVEVKNEVAQHYGILPEDITFLDEALHRFMARMKTRGTFPLRVALVKQILKNIIGPVEGDE